MTKTLAAVKPQYIPHLYSSIPHNTSSSLNDVT